MYFTISCVTFILCLYGASTDNTTDYILQLEQKISHLESHSLAAEQKQAAVLSSILSRLQSQEEQLKSQEQKIQSQEQKLQSQEQTMRELKTELENDTTTDCLSASSSGPQPVVFEAKTSHDIPMTSRVHFDQISTNVGGAYSSHTGVFTAPRNGTFQIWFRVNIDSPSKLDGHVVRVTGGSGATIDGTYVAPKILMIPQHHVYKVLQDVLAVSLVKGDQVYLTISPPCTVKSASSFGGVFLGDM